MTQPRVTLHEAAKRLGVHYMTAYRYVRTGRLPAERDGVHWLIDPIELERLAAQPSPRPRGQARAVAPARLAARLVAGDEAGAWAIVESTLASGADPDDVLVDVIAAAMRNIGDGWAAGTLDVSDEHRATVVVERIVGRMGPRFTRRGRKRGMIVLGTPPKATSTPYPARSSPTCSEPLASRSTTSAPTPQQPRSPSPWTTPSASSA